MKQVQPKNPFSRGKKYQISIEMKNYNPVLKRTLRLTYRSSKIIGDDTYYYFKDEWNKKWQLTHKIITEIKLIEETSDERAARNLRNYFSANNK